MSVVVQARLEQTDDTLIFAQSGRLQTFLLFFKELVKHCFNCLFCRLRLLSDTFANLNTFLVTWLPGSVHVECDISHHLLRANGSQQEFLILAVPGQVLDVPAQLDERFFAGFDEFPVHVYSILIKDV